MSVRAKMSCSSVIKGNHGSEAYFNAVYEGSAELQAISENAVFGNATPTGSVTLAGGFDPKTFEQNEEYYIDLWRTEAGNQAQSRSAILVTEARLVFRSAPNPNHPTNPIMFRYALDAEGTVGQLYLGVLNPQAIGEIDGMGALVNMTVTLARGRRSDAEIALRQKVVDDMREQLRTNERLTDAERETYLSSYLRKLAIAKGEL